MLAAVLPPDVGLWALLALAFGTGLVHALDADHIAAVSALAAHNNSWRKVMRVSGAWAIGHGATLLAVGVGVLIIGFAIPDDLAAIAERAVGLVLVAVGASLVWQLVRQRAHLHTHAHDDLPPHAHLHTHEGGDHHERRDRRHEHRAVLVGSVHGLAGSAPLLALIPLSKLGSPAMGIAYLAAFGAGVFIAMALFGGLFGGLISWGSRAGHRLLSGIQLTTATLSIALGFFLLLGA